MPDVLAAAEIPERVPCDACRLPVDPLRAPQVAVVHERYRFYCSRECRERATPAPLRPRSHARDHRPTPPSVAETVTMLGIPLASLPPGVLDGTALPHTPAAPADATTRPGDELADPMPPAVAVSAAMFAVLVGAVSVLPLTLRVVTLFGCAAAGVSVSARELWRARSEHAPLAWVCSLVGAMVPFIDALRSSGELVPSGLREAAVLAAIGPVVAWASRARRAEGETRMGSVRDALPRTAKVPTREPQPEGAPLATEALDADRLRAGAEVIVDHGAAVPVDGVVLDGEASVRLWPGAATLRTRKAGDAVLAGAQVLDGTLRVLATRAGDEVAWARLARMMHDAASAPRIVRLARSVGLRAPYAAVALAVAAAVVHGLWTTADGLLAAACALALCPCAVSAPVVEMPFVDALVAAARRGIVFRDAASVESSARVGLVALCLRGTVTRGVMELTEVVPLGVRTEAELLATTAAVEEADASDPIARALTEAVSKRSLRLQNIRRPAVVPGQGITAVSAAGDPVLVGNRRLLLAEGVSVAPGEETAASIEGAGRTAVFVAVDGRLEAVLGFEDVVRDEVRSAVQAMIDAGCDVALLGGASRATMEAIGATLDVSNLRPEVLPDERPAVVRALAEVSSGAAVVGRPGRDSATLAAANVAISIDAAGGAAAETAVALASDDLRDAAAALRMARKAQARALAAMSLGVTGAALGSLVAAALPAWGLTVTVMTALAVLGGQGLALRDTDEEEPR